MTGTFIIDGHEIRVDFDGKYVDNGIGNYEYWGARGVHEDWEWELDVNEAYLVRNGREREIVISFAIWEKLESMLIEHCEDMGRDCDGPDDY